MEPNSTKPFPYAKALTGLRGTAFLLVFFAHISQFYRLPILNSGKEGLIVFFILSAFLLTRHMYDSLSDHLSAKRYTNYFVRRFFRIYPMYLVALLTAKMLGVGNIGYPEIMQHLLLQQGNMHFWSIPVELQYYFVIPIIVTIAVLLFQRRLGLFLILSLVVVLGYGFAFPTITQATAQGLPNEINLFPYLPVFLFGSIAAVLTATENYVTQFLYRYKTLLLSLSLFMIAVGFPFSYWDFLQSKDTFVFYKILLYFTIPATYITFSLATTATFLTSMFTSRLLVFLGTISFSAYLFHYLILIWFTTNYPILNPWLATSIVLFATITLSTVTYYCVEKPFLKIRLR